MRSEEGSQRKYTDISQKRRMSATVCVIVMSRSQSVDQVGQVIQIISLIKSG